MSSNHSRPVTAVTPHGFRLLAFLVVFALLIVFVSPQPLCAQARGLASAGQHLKLSATLPPATVGVAYNAQISVSGGVAPYTYKAHYLPAGLVLDEGSGVISGIPQYAGQHEFAVWVRDSTVVQGLGQFTLTVNGPSSIGISISSNSATVNSGATAQLQATVTNTSNIAVSWTASAGTISSSGLFTAPIVTSSTSVLVTATSAADTTKSASASISVSAVSGGGVALEVLFPPTHPRQAYYNDVQTYLLHNPLVSGANIVLQWASVDNGPGVNPQYDWTAMDAAAQQWIAAGKKVNLIVWTISDGPTNTATPQYVWNNLGPANYTTCNGQQIPNYFNPAYQLSYQQFMAQVLNHYGSNPGIGYIRFGLGRGGESNPARGLGSEPMCSNAFTNQWGWTETAWINYLNSMLNYEASLKSPKRLMLGVVGTSLIRNVPQATAATAVAAGIGIGSQGMQAADITNYPNCSSGWCNLFNQYAGQVPLELQTIGLSCPAGAGQCPGDADQNATGSLVPLIPFGISHHAAVFEIYYRDWLLAFDPAYPGYGQYGAAYAQVLTQAVHSAVQ